MSPASRSGMKEALSQIAIMNCHSIDVVVEGKAAQCRDMEETAGRCDILGNEYCI